MKPFPLAVTIALLISRLANLTNYYHHDLKTIIPAIQCWCFPSNVPYGYIWYLVDWPLSFNYPLLLAVVDFLVALTILKYAMFWIYLPISWIIYYSAPYDLPIMWLSLLGIISPWLLTVAPVAKLPDNLAMWNFVIRHPFSVNDFEYYLLAALPWLWILTVHIRHKWTFHKSFKHPPIFRSLQMYSIGKYKRNIQIGYGPTIGADNLNIRIKNASAGFLGAAIGIVLVIFVVAALVGPVANFTTGITIAHTGFTPNPNVTNSPGAAPLLQIYPLFFAIFGLLAAYEIVKKEVGGGF